MVLLNSQISMMPTIKYVLELDDAFFKVLDTYLNNPTRDAKNFKVEGVAGSFNEGKYQIAVDNTDRALDGKVDMTINTPQDHLCC